MSDDEPMVVFERDDGSLTDPIPLAEWEAAENALGLPGGYFKIPTGNYVPASDDDAVADVMLRWLPAGFRRVEDE